MGRREADSPLPPGQGLPKADAPRNSPIMPMTIFLIILSVTLWVAAFAFFGRRILLSPALSYCALMALSFTSYEGLPLVPVGNAMSLSWLCITLVVMLIIVLQNPAVRIQSRGTGYMLLGAVAGMAVGLLGYTFTSTLNTLYAMMMGGTAVGCILGLHQHPRRSRRGTGHRAFLELSARQGIPCSRHCGAARHSGRNPYRAVRELTGPHTAHRCALMAPLRPAS